MDNIVRVCKALEKNRYVLDLSMTGCGLEDREAHAVAKMLSRNDTLKSVNLETNNILGEALKAIIVALQDNKTLTELKLTNQKQLIATDVERTLAKDLEPNTTLLKLSISIKDVTSRNNVDRVLMRNAETVSDLSGSCRCCFTSLLLSSSRDSLVVVRSLASSTSRRREAPCDGRQVGDGGDGG